MVVRSQKAQPLIDKRMLRREKRSMTRRKSNVTAVRSLVTLLETVGQTRRENQKKQI
jgi:hypothetical protein